MPSRLARFAVLMLAFTLLGGCVAQGKLDRMRRLYYTAKEQNVDLQGQLEEARSRIRALKQAKSEDPEAQQRIKDLQARVEELEGLLADAKEQIANQPAGPGIIPERVNRELERLAANNPELTYVKEKGMVKFASDFTFDLGSAKVSDKGKQTVRQVAQVLQKPAAEPFDIRIVGHTDAVPIKKASTKAKHPTNWHLSVHRAIAIEEVLEGAGVPPKRMGVAGYGQYRPIAPNGSDGSNEKNRRVELYLHQSDVSAGMGGSSSSNSGSNGGSGNGSAEPRMKSGSTDSSGPDEDAPVRYK